MAARRRKRRKVTKQSTAAVAQQAQPTAAAKSSGKGVGRRYSNAERSRILAAAKREKLTGAQVKARFGVSTLSFYLWRKKAGKSSAPRRGQGHPRKTGSANFAGSIESAIRERVRELLPRIVEAEVQAALGHRRTR